MDNIKDTLVEYWNILATWVSKTFEIGQGDFYGAVYFTIFSLIVTTIIYIFRKTLSSFFSAISFFSKNTFTIPSNLKSYKEALENDTSKLNHSWKLEEQSLENILIPVYINDAKTRKRILITEFLDTEFQSNQTPRCLIKGDAGSGKSVALGRVAREIWKIRKDKVTVPVLLSFSDIKNVKKEEEFIDIIVKNLESLNFEKGKRNQNAEFFVQNNLFNGNIVLLLDGLDELEKSNRYDIAKFLKQFLKVNPNVPCIITSRSNVWKQTPQIFSPVKFTKVEVAEFTLQEVKLFIYKWDLPKNKSGEQLFELIANKPYLNALVRNPLLLTIITFLYSQPKRILPDNRVKFYEECVDALFEKWDNTKSLDRANQFETIDKVAVLSKLAYKHIVDSQSTDEDISKEKVLSIITEVMRDLSRRVEKREQMLSEITQNAELLVELPPSDYKFPHRTFMEYFAAKYFAEQHLHEELIELYKNDYGKWEETLSLFCGINTDMAVSNQILNFLIDEFEKTKSTQKVNYFVFKALAESACINPQIAEKILSIAEKILKKKINRTVIEYIGYIAVNPTWAHADKAKEVLLTLLKRQLSHKDFQEVFSALIHLKDEDIQSIILNHSEKIDLKRFFGNIGNDSLDYASKLLDTVSQKKHTEILNGLMEAGQYSFLLYLMIKSKSEKVREAISYLFCINSADESLFHELENLEYTEQVQEFINSYEKDCKKIIWKRNSLKSNIAKRIGIVISFLAAKYLRNKDFNVKVDDSNTIHPHLLFLLNIFHIEKGDKSLILNSSSSKTYYQLTKEGLLSHWYSEGRIINTETLSHFNYGAYLILTVLLQIVIYIMDYEIFPIQIILFSGTIIFPVMIYFDSNKFIDKAANMLLSNDFSSFVFLLLCAFPLLYVFYLNEKNGFIRLALYFFLITFILIIVSLPLYYKIGLMIINTSSAFASICSFVVNKKLSKILQDKDLIDILN